VSFNHAGSCVVDANQAGNADYLAANQVQQSIAVGKGTQALSFGGTPPSPALVGDTYTPTATSNAGLVVAITLDGTSTGCSLSSGVVTFTGVGTCKVDANQGGNADYQPAAQIQQSFAVSKRDQTVTFSSTAPSNATVGGTQYVAAATASSLLTPVTFSSTTASVCTSGGTNGATFSFVGAGTCTVVAAQAGDSTYNSATAPQSFTVAAAVGATKFAVSAATPQTAGTSFNVTITAQDASNNTVAAYTGNHNITFSTTAGNSPSGATPSLPAATVAFTNGVATVSVTLVKAETGRSITANDGTIQGTSNNVNVNAAGASRLAWTNFSPANASCFFTCDYIGLGGNGGTFKAKIQLTDLEGNPVAAGSQVSITVTTAPGGTFTGSATVTIASGQSVSNGGGDGSVAGEITFKTETGSWTKDTLSMTSTPSFTGALATFAK
jgi:hypothetical protein